MKHSFTGEFGIRLVGAFFLPLLVALSGCRTIARQIGAQADRRYAEVRLGEWEKSLAAHGSTLRVLLVHGMNNHPFGISGNKPHLHGSYTYAALREQLGSWAQAEPTWRTALISDAVANSSPGLIRQIADRFGHKGETGETQFSPIKDPTSGKVLGYFLTREFPATARRAGLKFYVANWALSVAELKEEEFGSWGFLDPVARAAGHYIEGRASDTDPELNRHRAMLNQRLKLHTVNWGLADPSLYLTSAGGPIRRVVSNALRDMAEEASPGDRAIIVAESLGSTIALDCARAFLEGSNPEGVLAWNWGEDALSSRQRLFGTATPDSRNGRSANAAIYLFANQWALLNMGRQPEQKTAAPDKALKAFDAALATFPKKENQRAVVQIYGFTDPNDLLSYPLNPKLNHASTCNVYVRNPGLNILGLFMNPGDAHLNYEKNPHVIQAMFEGPQGVRLPQ